MSILPQGSTIAVIGAGGAGLVGLIGFFLFGRRSRTVPGPVLPDTTSTMNRRYSDTVTEEALVVEELGVPLNKDALIQMAKGVARFLRERFSLEAKA